MPRMVSKAYFFILLTLKNEKTKMTERIAWLLLFMNVSTHSF